MEKRPVGVQGGYFLLQIVNVTGKIYKITSLTPQCQLQSFLPIRVNMETLLLFC